MTRVVDTANRVAAAASLGFLALTVFFGVRYARSHAGWDIASGDSGLIAVMLAALGFVLALSFALLRPGRHNPDGARLTAIVWTVALLLGLAFCWWVIVTADRWRDDFGTAIHSQQALEAFIAEHPGPFAAYDYRVPTGVYLQSFEFLNANNVEMSGYVWQTYGPEIPDHVLRGIVLPEALEDAYDAVEAWRVERDGVEHIGWYFSGTFRQNFNYDLYPFDRQDIWVRLWSPEPVESVILVPDFAAYRDPSPLSLPGVDPGFVYGGWDPLRSEFTYLLLDYTTDFGLGYGFSGVPDPELFFNLEVGRDSLSPMLEHLILELAIAVLVYFVLLLMSERSARSEGSGLSAFDLIVAAGGLLFAVILDHNAIRAAVESQTITYLEYFPLVLEVFIVLVVLSAVLRARGIRLPFLAYTGSLVSVLAYWPALLGTLLVITVLTFFF